MSTFTRYILYGPDSTLRRLAPKLQNEFTPTHHYQYESSEKKVQIDVMIFEEYEKQINATVTLACIIESSGERTLIELKKSGGRMGFRGSSLSEDHGIETDVTDFVMDYSKRFGLSLQEVLPDESDEEEES